MILILSHASLDFTTDEVIDWLEARGASFLRVNSEDLDNGSSMRCLIDGEHTSFLVEIDGVELDFSKIRAVWFRRWAREWRHQGDSIVRDVEGGHQIHYEVVRHLAMESRRVTSLFFSRLAGLPWLSSLQTSTPDKLDVLERAARFGIDTPATLVATRRADVERFAERYGSVITKPLSETRLFSHGGKAHIMYTAALSRDDVGALPARFSPSLFQERIEKSFELRIFYLDRQFFAMAIFSQLDPQTEVDFRVYNTQRPSRCVPYRLMDDTASRLRALMTDIGLDTGSLDLIVTPGGRHVFLEVNPVGQFGMVSHPCNYHLERRVAEYLIEMASHVQN